jgi:hypothetical protein
MKMVALPSGETEQENRPVRWHRETKWREEQTGA